MSAYLLPGKPAADAIIEQLRPKVAALKPALTIVQVGSDSASTAYIRKKMEACKDIGIDVLHLHLTETTTHEELLQVVQRLNVDPSVSGYIIQLPLPEHLWPTSPLLFRAIDPKKDVDGFTAYNAGKVFLSKEFEHLPPATPAGVIALLEHYSIEIAGKNVVIVGRSNLVGKPLGIMLLHRDATVTICHSKTPNLAEHCKRADILVSAVGKPRLITKGHVKPGAIVIDIGITRTDEGLVGDVDADAVQEVAAAITPVPGGVGPMTVACLLRNVVTAKERQLQ